MQMCHGKRKCALGVDPATFGNPCKPESVMYLKVIHTCGRSSLISIVGESLAQYEDLSMTNDIYIIIKEAFT